jgi:hypothetical protein
MSGRASIGVGVRVGHGAPLVAAAARALVVGCLAAALGACGEGEPVLSDGDIVHVGPDTDGDGLGLDGFPGPGDGGEDAPSDGAFEVGDTAPPPRSCARDEDCADRLACTDDVCGDGGFCVWTLRPNRCLINHVCYERGQIAPRDPCAVCLPSAQTQAWSPREDGAPCVDGSRCTVGTTCQAGECVGEEIACDDGNDCTEDACDPDEGCVFFPVEDGADCDDRSACTHGDVCDGGQCRGQPLDCDDGNACTLDSCDPASGCVSTERAGSCDDGDACTVADTCDAGACVGGEPANCDDGNVCTINLCDERVGCAVVPSAHPCCVGETSICDDGDPCTTDLCGDAPGECFYEHNTAACDDRNACTTLDRCEAGACSGRPVVCDDGNPCTENACNTVSGCLFLPLTGTPCSDGIACTLDECVAGVCVSDASACACDPDFSPVALKATALRVGVSGRPGEGLDVDGDPSTCAPAGNCSGGINNALSLIATFVNADLEGAIDAGSLILLLELRDFALNPFLLAVYTGELDPANAGCAVQTEACDYLVSASALDPLCEPLVRLPANRVGNRIFAGGPGTVLPFDVPLGDGVLSLTLYEVQLEGTLVVAGGEISSMAGILAGAVLRGELLAALEALPPGSLPLTPAELASLLEVLVPDDIDVDGDGTPDAMSIGLPLQAIRGHLSGVAE